MPKPQILSHEQAKRFYDRMGAKQDTQCFYERPALVDLVANLELAGAERLIEFGCGTGRFVEELFVRYLPQMPAMSARCEQHDDQTRTEPHSTIWELVHPRFAGSGNSYESNRCPPDSRSTQRRATAKDLLAQYRLATVVASNTL